MNIQSEVEFFSELGTIDKARLLLAVAAEIAEEAKVGAPGGELSRLKFTNEINQRLTRFANQVISEDASRPQDDVVIRMLLGTRLDKDAERIVHNAYARILNSFESFDTTVLLNTR